MRTVSSAEIETVDPHKTTARPRTAFLRLPLADSSPNSPNLLIAKRGKGRGLPSGKQRLLLERQRQLVKKPDSDYYRWFTFDDRKMY
jgi:hypothetical protein